MVFDGSLEHASEPPRPAAGGRGLDRWSIVLYPYGAAEDIDSELRRELCGIAKAAAPKIEPERPSPTLAPPSAAPAPKAQQPPVESTATAGKPKPKACWAGQGWR